jgi:hypothetical protein
MRRFGPLEWLMILAFLTLALQLMPSLPGKLLHAADVRTWTTNVWFSLQGLILLTLLAIRYRADFQELWENRAERKTKEDAKAGNIRKAQEAKERREMLERIKLSRSRRIY